jgi:hypothetical protein
MSINVTGPDGRVHTFANGTSSADIERHMRRTYGAAPAQRQATARAAQALDRRPATPQRQRSLWERFDDRLQDSLQNSYGALARAVVTPRDTSDRTTTSVVRDPETGQVVQRRTSTGAERRAIREGIAASERQRRSDLDARTQGDEWYRAPGGAVGQAAAGVATIGGELVGAALDPTSWINAGRTVVTRLSFGAASNAASDGLAQGSDLSTGVAEDWDTNRTLLAAATGGGLSLTTDLVGMGAKAAARRFMRQPEADAAADLEIGDQLNLPALIEDEIVPTPPRVTLEEPTALPRNQQADEGIEVETPDGQLVNVPNRPEGGPEGSQRADGDPNPETGTWEDLNHSARKSPERVKAAIAHLADLQKAIKPEQVRAFLRLLDEGVDDAAEGIHINEDWVDWDAMGDPNVILGLQNAMAGIFKDVYDKAGDSVKTWKMQEQTAKQFGFTVSDAIKTHADITGEGGLSVRTGVIRDMALASDKAFADQLREVRAALAKGDKSGIPKLAESLNRTILMSAMDAGAGSEIARALQYRKRLGKPQFPANDLQAAMDELGSILNKGGDIGDDEALGKVLDELTDSYAKGGSAGMRQTIRKIRELGFWDYVGYYSTASLLSAPTTHIRNMTGTPIHALFQVGERYTAAGIGALRTAAGLGSRERVTFREANAYVGGVTQAWTEGLSLGFQAFKRGAPVTDARSSVMTGEQASVVPFAFSRERAEGWAANPTSPKVWADAAGTLVFAIQRTLGFRLSVATDEFFKAFGRKMQVNALAHREAAYRSAVAGPDKADAVYQDTLKRMQEQPTAEAFREAQLFFDGKTASERSQVFEPGSREEEMALILRSVDHRQMALDHAQLLTFQSHGPVTDALDKALNALPLVKHLYVNFVRTPIAILKAGMVDRNLVIGTLNTVGTKQGRAEFKAMWKSLTDEEEALARGGAEADLVIARQVVGSAVLGTLWLMWAGGGITGKQSPEERREGVLDYSVKLPNGTWVQYTGLSPLGEMIGLVADTANEFRKRDPEDNEAAAVMGALAAAVRNNIVNKSFLKGMSDFFELATGGSYGAPEDQTKSGEQIGNALVQAAVPRMVPGGSLLGRIAQDIDPVQRDARGFMENIWARIPLMSEQLAAKRDFMGRPLIRKPGERGAFQAFNTSSPNTDPLNRAMAALARENAGFSISATPKGDMKPDEYSRLLEVQGQLVRRDGLNMEEALRQLITTPEYMDAHPAGQAYQFKRVVERYREEGRRALSNPTSDFYMGTYAKRTGLKKWEERATSRSWSSDQAWGRATEFGLDPEDPEVRALHSTLFPEE